VIGAAAGLLVLLEVERIDRRPDKAGTPPAAPHPSS
jgi:hypothetical protein